MRLLLGAFALSALAVLAASPSMAQASFTANDAVDVQSPRGGGWKAKVVRLDDTITDGRVRYLVHPDDPRLQDALLAVPAEQLRPRAADSSDAAAVLGEDSSGLPDARTRPADAPAPAAPPTIIQDPDWKSPIEP
jgi:hypothetical protein